MPKNMDSTVKHKDVTFCSELERDNFIKLKGKLEDSRNDNEDGSQHIDADEVANILDRLKLGRD